ncbi:MAG: hypothetical protein GTN39_03120 [Candidatus Aenigmarchaeota archaeon]|nr:hypothetical protein [Candidatus Aenigmarchaeota archaeon]
MSEFEKRLNKMNDDWKDGKDTPPGPPDGTYAFQLQKAELREAQSSGKLYIAREHLVIDGEYEGEVVRDMMSLETDRGPYYIAKWIEKMGYEAPDKAKDIPDTLEAIQNDAPTYTGSIKHSGDFINVRVMEVLEGGDGGGKSSPEDTGEKETGVADKAEGDTTIDVGTKVKFEDEDGNELIGEVTDNSDQSELHVEVDDDVYGVAAEDCEIVDDDDSGGDPDPDPDEDNLVELLAIAQACEVEGISEDISLDDLVAAMSDYEWDAGELLEEETEALTRNGIAVKGAKKKGGKAKPKKK